MDISKLDKKQTVFLGIRIGFIYVVAFLFLIVSAYFVLLENFKDLMTDYSLKLVQAMVRQGVTTVEYELQTSQKEALFIATSFEIPKDNEKVKFPETFFMPNTKRIVYVSQNGSFASDDNNIDIRNRADVKEAFNGNTAYYGPYFNENNEYIICYSAPIYKNNEIIGVISIEKDGYYFCSLIQDIRFIDSGEAYIINGDGTDIAVSKQQHIDWVNEQYNAENILKEQEDFVTRSIFELEQKGLDGESGFGTYYWDDGLCYLFYEPINSSDWVLLAGLREDEISAMVKDTMHISLTKGPTLGLCITIFLILTAAIIFWSIMKLKKSADINKKLELVANYDVLTGLMNRNGYQAALELFSDGTFKSFSCIYIDVNGLHEINNHLGHQAGDKMLQSVADMLKHIFIQGNNYRIGGDEFVTFSLNCDKQDVYKKAKLLRDNLKNEGYEISIGVEWRDNDINITKMLRIAEEEMLKDKEQYYRDNGKERQIRTLDKELEQMILQKQDADTFLSILAPEYKGVYFVNLDTDSVRHLYIPSYFEELLKESFFYFSTAIHAYSQKYVLPEYQEKFDKFSDYKYLSSVLNRTQSAEFIYEKIDGTKLKLQVLKFKTYTSKNRETLWIFSNIN